MTEFRQHGSKWLFGPGPHHVAFPSKMDDDAHGKGHSLRPLYGMTTHEREDDEDYESPEGNFFFFYFYALRYNNHDVTFLYRNLAPFLRSEVVISKF